MENLEERIERLEAIEEIKVLKYKYTEICDDHHNPDAIMDLFTEDGLWDGSECYCETFRGKQEIHDGFSQFGEFLTFTQHNMLSPRITITSETTATGVWNGIVFCRSDSREPYVTCNIYHDEYVKQNGRWLFKSTKPKTVNVFNFASDTFKDTLDENNLCKKI